MSEGGFLLPEFSSALAVDVRRHGGCITLWNIVRHLLHSTAKAHSAAHKITAVIETHAQRRIFFASCAVFKSGSAFSSEQTKPARSFDLAGF